MVQEAEEPNFSRHAIRRSSELDELKPRSKGLLRSLLSIVWKHLRHRGSQKVSNDTESLKQNHHTAEENLKPCPLLSLPSELRTHIYRYVLVDVDKFEVSKTNCMQPALLRSCRQIRTESLEMFHTENNFRVYLYDLEYDLSEHHWSRTGVPSPRRSWHYRGTWKWSNLKQWLHDRHCRSAESVSRPHATDTGRDYRMVASLFNIVDMMKAHPWEEVEKILEEVRFVSIAGHGRLQWTA